MGQGTGSTKKRHQTEKGATDEDDDDEVDDEEVDDEDEIHNGPDEMEQPGMTNKEILEAAASIKKKERAKKMRDKRAAAREAKGLPLTTSSNNGSQLGSPEKLRGPKGKIVSATRSEVHESIELDLKIGRPCCLRCAHEYSTHPDLQCWRFEGNAKCDDCVRKSVECVPVSRYVKIFLDTQLKPSIDLSPLNATGTRFAESSHGVHQPARWRHR